MPKARRQSVMEKAEAAEQEGGDGHEHRPKAEDARQPAEMLAHWHREIVANPPAIDPERVKRNSAVARELLTRTRHALLQRAEETFHDLHRQAQERRSLGRPLDLDLERRLWTAATTAMDAARNAGSSLDPAVSRFVELLLLDIIDGHAAPPFKGSRGSPGHDRTNLRDIAYALAYIRAVEAGDLGDHPRSPPVVALEMLNAHRKRPITRATFKNWEREAKKIQLDPWVWAALSDVRARYARNPHLSVQQIWSIVLGHTGLALSTRKTNPN